MQHARWIALPVATAWLTVLVVSCARPPTRAQDIDWRTSPLDLDLRGMTGKRYRFECPPGKPIPQALIGTGVYTDGSSICTAATHAGAIDAQRGGAVTIEILPGQPTYHGSTQHYIASQDYAHPWGGSFAVMAGDAAANRR